MTRQPLRREPAAITGIGLVTPLGSDLAEVWAGLLAGVSTAADIKGFDTADLPVRFACQATSFEPEAILGEKFVRRTDRCVHMAMAAASAAIADSGPVEVRSDRGAVVTGSGFGGMQTLDELLVRAARNPAAPLDPLTIPKLMPNAAAAAVSMATGWTGPSLTMTTACASGAHALGEALRLLRDHDADVVLAGGAEAPIGRFILSAFAKLNALSRRNADPRSASRPFDVRRDGFVLGEGSGFCVLERLSDAAARGARVHAVLAGYGRTDDAFDFVRPRPDGQAAAACMDGALADAGVTPRDVAHVNAHGTSTPLNDAAEARAIETVFGAHQPPVTSTKGAVGHLVGAAGVVEAIVTAAALEAGVVPPVANTTTVDPALGIDVVVGQARALGRGAALSNSFGFGGHNASLVLLPAS
jgi:3-oxoacyl-[acyl-carrier-protein] synthase II